jgi:tetratricopeptide (TPR) repeat protein
VKLAPCRSFRTPGGAEPGFGSIFRFALFALLIFLPAFGAWSQPDPQTPSSSTSSPLKMADPSTFPAARSEREGIEKAILKGDPNSLDAADSLIAASRQLPPSELATLKATVTAFRQALYPRNEASSLASLALPSLAGRPVSALLAEVLACLPLFGPDPAAYADAAIQAASRIEAAGANSVLPCLFRGRCSETLGDRENASTQYRNALDAFPKVWPAALGLARCEYSLGHFAQAAAVVDAFDPEALSLPPALSLGARILHANDRLSEAYVMATRALASLPHDAAASLIRAQFLAESGEYSIALGILAELPKPESTTRLYFELRALVDQGMKDIDAMLSWARRGLDAFPDDPGLLVLASRALFSGSESEFPQAEEYARRALDVLGLASSSAGSANPNTPSPIDSPLEIARRAKAGREASRLLIIASTSGSNWNDALSYMDLAGKQVVDRKTQASILRNAGRIQDALVYTQAWYKEEPSSEDALEAYLRVLLGAGKGDEAGTLASSIPNQGISSHLASYLLYLKGRMARVDDEALLFFRDALFEQADNIDALVALAELHLRLNEPERASFYYKQATMLGTSETDLAGRLAVLGASLGTRK